MYFRCTHPRAPLVNSSRHRICRNHAFALALLISSGCAARTPTEVPASPAPVVPAVSTDERPKLRKVRVVFRGPMGEERRLLSAHIELRPLAGGEPTIEDFQARDERFWQVSEHVGPVAPGRYALTVESPGARPYHGFVDVGPLKDEHTGVADQGERVDALLWPEDRIPVRVQTPEGGDAAELSTSLGIDPSLLFVGSFRVLAVPSTATTIDWNAPANDHGAVTRPVDEWLWRTSDGSLAAIDASRLPLRVGLELLGVPVGVETVDAGSTEVVFHLDAAALAARLGSLRFKLVRRGAPASDARVSLLPRNEYHRRPEFVDAAPSADGGFTFEHLCPGTYELRIERGRSARTEQLTIAPGEEVALADIDLDATPEMRYRVVDERGRGVQAILDLVPFDPALDAHAQLSEAIPIWTDGGGRGSVPVPRRKVLARAWAANPHGANELDPHSGFVVFAPGDPKVTELVLVLRPSVEIGFRVERADARELEIRDEHGLVVAREPTRPTETTHVHLVRGRYVARLTDARAALLVERSFEVRDEPATIELR